MGPCVPYPTLSSEYWWRALGSVSLGRLCLWRSYAVSWDVSACERWSHCYSKSLIPAQLLDEFCDFAVLAALWSDIQEIGFLSISFLKSLNYLGWKRSSSPAINLTTKSPHWAMSLSAVSTHLLDTSRDEGSPTPWGWALQPGTSPLYLTCVGCALADNVLVGSCVHVEYLVAWMLLELELPLYRNVHLHFWWETEAAAGAEKQCSLESLAGLLGFLGLTNSHLFAAVLKLRIVHMNVSTVFCCRQWKASNVVFQWRKGWVVFSFFLLLFSWCIAVTWLS